MLDYLSDTCIDAGDPLNALDNDYKALVAADVRKEVSPAVREHLAADPERWMAALLSITNDVQSQLTEREASLKAYRIECFRMADGRELYAQAEVDYLRWRSRAKRFLGILTDRHRQVKAMAKTHKQQVHSDRTHAELKALIRNLVVEVDALLSVPEGDDIPATIFDRLSKAYDELPSWLLPD